MKKSTLLAVLVCAALAVATFAVLREKPERGITRVSFAGIDPDRVTAIHIKGSNPIDLERKDGTWLTEGKPADANAVQRLLSTVTSMRSDDLVTRNPERFADLEVEGDAATRVELQAGAAPVASFTVGKSLGGGGVNVRVGNAVYAVRSVYRGTFSRARSAWLDRTLFHDKVADVQRVEVKLAGKPAYSLVRKGKEWRLEEPASLPDGQRFDKAAARGLVSALVDARATDILDKAPGVETTGLGETADILTFSTGGKEGVLRRLRLGKAGEKGTVYASASTRNDVVTVPAYVAGNLRKTLADLRDLRLMSFDTGKVTRLELVRDQQRLVFTRSDKGWDLAESSEKTADDFDLDPGLVRARIGRLANARATADAGGAGAAATGLGKASAVASLTLENGESIRLRFGRETTRDDQKLVYAAGNADDFVYVVPLHVRDSLFGGLQTFVRHEAAGGGLANIDPKALQKLPPEVRKNLLRQLAQKQQQQKLIEQIKKKQRQE